MIMKIVLLCDRKRTCGLVSEVTRTSGDSRAAGAKGSAPQGGGAGDHAAGYGLEGGYLGGEVSANDANPVVQDFVRCCLDNKPPA